MDSLREHTLNQAAYRRLKASLDQTYPPGRFLAIHQGRLVADAASFEELNTVLAANRLDSTEILVVQAGVDYPETAVIFSP